MIHLCITFIFKGCVEIPTRGSRFVIKFSVHDDFLMALELAYAFFIGFIGDSVIFCLVCMFISAYDLFFPSIIYQMDSHFYTLVILKSPK